MPLHKAFERVDDNNRGADENGTFDISWRIIIRHRHLSLPGARAFALCPTLTFNRRLIQPYPAARQLLCPLMAMFVRIGVQFCLVRKITRETKLHTNPSKAKLTELYGRR